MDKSIYTFEGSVLKFGKVISRKWTCDTIASSENKAISNIKYRYKQEFNMAPNCKIELDGYLNGSKISK